WLTRRLSLAMLERAAKFLLTTSPLASRTLPDHRREVVGFERDAALATTAKAMSVTPTDVLTSSASTSELADRLTITQPGEGFRMELVGDSGGSATAVVARPELQRILGMLETEVVKAGWVMPIAAPAQPPAAKPV